MMVATAKKFYALVEGHGDTAAAHNLLARLAQSMGITTPWTEPRRWPNIIHWRKTRKGYGGLRKGLELIRRKGDVAGLLILRDSEDECPKETAPKISAQIQTQDLPFKTAVVLLRPEYEVLFLPCMHRMRENGLQSKVQWDGATWESRRDLKGWLDNQLPEGYKPTMDQLPMTRRIDFDELAKADVPCFGSLVRAIRFLGDAESTAKVYPSVA